MISGTSPHRLGVLLAVGWSLWVFGATPTAGGVRVTEVLTAPCEGPDARPAYLELFYDDPPEAFDLAVLNASPGRSPWIERLIRLEMKPGRETILLHEGTWPKGPGAEEERPRIALPEGGLGFGGGTFGTARRLVVFDGPAVRGDTGAPFEVRNPVPKQSLWPETLDVADSVALSFDGGEVASLDPSHAALQEAATLDLEYGEAAYRWHDGVDYENRFETGLIDPQLSFEDGTTLDPGQLNRWSSGGAAPMPAPTTAVTMVAALLGAGAVSRRRPRASGRRSSGLT
jgi:hypothetical protein